MHITPICQLGHCTSDSQESYGSWGCHSLGKEVKPPQLCAPEEQHAEQLLPSTVEHQQQPSHLVSLCPTHDRGHTTDTTNSFKHQHFFIPQYSLFYPASHMHDTCVAFYSFVIGQSTSAFLAPFPLTMFTCSTQLHPIRNQAQPQPHSLCPIICSTNILKRHPEIIERNLKLERERVQFSV